MNTTLAERLTAEQEASEEWLRQQFLRATVAGDMKAVAEFAPQTADWPKRLAHGGNPMRAQTVGECLADSLEYSAPDRDEAMALICKVANGGDCAAEARDLLNRMAATWAWQNAGLES